MNLTEQIFAHALLLAEELEPDQMQKLRVLCGGTAAALERQLKNGLHPEDCKADFIAGASLLAVAALSDVRDGEPWEQISLGNVNFRRKTGDAAGNCLRSQAELMIAPYLKDGFSFLGV